MKCLCYIFLPFMLLGCTRDEDCCDCKNAVTLPDILRIEICESTPSLSNQDGLLWHDFASSSGANTWYDVKDSLDIISGCYCD